MVYLRPTSVSVFRSLETLYVTDSEPTDVAKVIPVSELISSPLLPSHIPEIPTRE